MTWYLLADDGKTPIPTTDLVAVEKIFSDKAARQLALTDITDPEGGIGISISTVFLALDHAYGGGAPVLWETMIFTAMGEHPLAENQNRYTSHDAAAEGHAQMVRDAIAQWPRPEFIQDLREQFDIQPSRQGGIR